MGVLANVREAIRTFVAPGDDIGEDNEMSIREIIAVHPELMAALKNISDSQEDVEKDPYARVSSSRGNFASKYKGRKGAGGEEMTAEKLEKMKAKLSRKPEEREISE